MKTFLNSFRNFVFCLKFHLQQFSPLMKISKIPLSPSFSPPLNFEKSSSPRISLSSKIQFPTLHKGGEEPLWGNVNNYSF